MELLIFVVLLIVPVKIAATLLGAERTGYFVSFLAVLGVLSFETAKFIYFPQLDFWGMSFLTSALIYMIVLGINYIKALGVSIVQIVIMIGAVLVLNVIDPDIGIKLSIAM
jgi:hypothetical protein